MKVRFGLMMILLGGTTLSAQQIVFDFGARAGVPITQPVPPLTHSPTSQTTIEGPRLAAAPTFTLLVDNRFGVDVEALFRPIRYKTESEETCCSSSDSTRATALEVPVIGSYHFGNHTIRPYAGAGLIIYERQWGRVDARTILHNQGNIQTHVVFPYAYSPSNAPPPFVFTGGIDYGKNRWLVRPELRYTHWRGQSLRRTDQWDFLVAITFRAIRLGSKRVVSN